MRKRLPLEFFERPAPEVALDLLGKYVVRKIGEKEIVSMVTEAEAYEGLDDLASHASKGRTKRTEIMFGEAGRMYVYLIYGMYLMLNIVTGKKEHPAGVLIRATADVTGPGRLTKYFKIPKEFNGQKVTPETGLWFEDRGISIPLEHVAIGPRVGVDYAGPIWSQKPWRFRIILPVEASKQR